MVASLLGANVSYLHEDRMLCTSMVVMRILLTHNQLGSFGFYYFPCLPCENEGVCVCGLAADLACISEASKGAPIIALQYRTL